MKNEKIVSLTPLGKEIQVVLSAIKNGMNTEQAIIDYSHIALGKEATIKTIKLVSELGYIRIEE